MLAHLKTVLVFQLFELTRKVMRKNTPIKLTRSFAGANGFGRNWWTGGGGTGEPGTEGKWQVEEQVV